MFPCGASDVRADDMREAEPATAGIDLDLRIDSGGLPRWSSYPFIPHESRAKPSPASRAGWGEGRSVTLEGWRGSATG